MSMEEYEASLKGKYKHQCWEWDGLTIDETCDEFAACDCFTDSAEIRKFKAEASKRIKEYKYDHNNL